MLPSLTDGFRNVHQANRRTFIAIAVMIVLWLAVVLSRHTIWAHWWAYKLRESEDVPDRLYYLGRLAGLGKDSVGVARQLLSCDDVELRSYGVHLLSRVETAESKAGLLAAVADPDPDIRRLALQAYAARDGADVVTELTRLMTDPHDDVAMWAVVSLVTKHGGSARPVVIDAARRHTNVAVRVQAIQALAMVDADEAIDTLIACLPDLTVFVGRTAIEESAAMALDSASAAGPTGQPPARPPTAGRIDNAPTHVVGEEAARALRALTGESFGYSAVDMDARQRAINAWRRWRDTQVRPRNDQSDVLTGA